MATVQYGIFRDLWDQEFEIASIFSLLKNKINLRKAFKKFYGKTTINHAIFRKPREFEELAKKVENEMAIMFEDKSVYNLYFVFEQMSSMLLELAKFLSRCFQLCLQTTVLNLLMILID